MDDNELEEGEISEENIFIRVKNEPKIQDESHTSYLKRKSPNRDHIGQRYKSRLNAHSDKNVRPKIEKWNNSHLSKGSRVSSWKVNYRNAWRNPFNSSRRPRPLSNRRTISPRRSFSMQSSRQCSLPNSKQALHSKSIEVSVTNETSYDELLAEYQKIKAQLKNLKEEELRNVHLPFFDDSGNNAMKNTLDKENETATNIPLPAHKGDTSNVSDKMASDKSLLNSIRPQINKRPKLTPPTSAAKKRRRRRQRARSNSKNTLKQDDDDEINELELRRLALESAAVRKNDNLSQPPNFRTSQQHKSTENQRFRETSFSNKQSRSLSDEQYLKESKEILLLSDPKEQYHRFINMVTNRRSRSQSSNYHSSRSPTPSSGKLFFSSQIPMEMEKRPLLNDLLDNYEEVEMDIDSSSEEIPTIYTDLDHIEIPDGNIDICFPPLPSEPYPFATTVKPPLPDAPLPDDINEVSPLIEDDDNDDVEALRELLISSMTRKRLEKKKVSDVEIEAKENCVDSGVRLEAGISVTDDNVPSPKASEKQKNHITKPKIPQHQPVVINLAEDSSDSEDSSFNKSVLENAHSWENGLDQLLKQARQTASISKTTSLSKLSTNTPKAMYDLPRAHLLEYRRLKLEIEFRERLKKSGSSANSPVQSDVDIGEIDKTSVLNLIEFEKKLRISENKLLHHRDNMQVDLQLLKKLNGQLNVKKSNQRSAELKVQKVKEQLVAAEKIVLANRQVIQKLNEQAQIIQSRVDQNFILEQELIKEISEISKFVTGKTQLKIAADALKQKSVESYAVPKKIKCNNPLGTRKITPPKKVQSILSSTTANQKIPNARPRMTREEIIHEKERLQKLEQEVAEKIRKLKLETKINSQKKILSVNQKELLKAKKTFLAGVNSSTKPDFPNLNLVQKTIDSSKDSLSISVTKQNSITKEIENNESQNLKVKDFIMPIGQQRENLIRLQKEKLQNNLTFESPASANIISNSELELFQPTLPKLSNIVIPCVTQRVMMKSQFESSSVPYNYTSPLLCLHSYRFSPYFRTQEGLNLISTLHCHKIDVNQAICSFDLMGFCNDDNCNRQHFKNMFLSSLETLIDIISFSPSLVGINDNTKFEDYPILINAYAENFLKLNESKMTVDEITLLLTNKILEKLNKVSPHYVFLDKRHWSPYIPKEFVEEGILNENKKMNIKKIDWLSFSTDLDYDSIISGNDIRYFSGDNNGLEALESAVLSSPQNIHLWLKLAFKWLKDDNSISVNLDHALNVLSRALEANYQNSELWLHYLNLYSQREDPSDLGELWIQALQLAPSYRLWWKYLQLGEKYSEKCERCQKIIKYLIDIEDSSYSLEMKSSQLLEIVLYQVQLNILTGRYKTALNIMQSILIPGSNTDDTVCNLFLPSDHCFAWLCYLHLLEFHNLPPYIYEFNNDGPSQIVSKEPFLLPWIPGGSVRTTPDTLILLFKTAIQSLKGGKKLEEINPEVILPLYRNFLHFQMTIGRFNEASEICHHVLKAFPSNSEFWIVLAKIKSITGPLEAIMQIFENAIEKNPFSAQLYHAAAKYHLVCSDEAAAITMLSRCANVFYKENFCDLLTLYDHLIGNPCSLKQPSFSSSVTSEIIVSEALYLRLNKCLYLSLKTNHLKTIEEFEAALGSQFNTKEMQAVWLEYIHFFITRKVIFNHEGSKSLFDLICRCLTISSTPSPCPCNPRSHWIDYSFCNTVIKDFVHCLPEIQITSAYRRFLEMMPYNVHLKQRFLEHLYHAKDYSAISSLCKTLDEEIKNSTLWRTAINLMLKENQINEVRRLFQKAIETIPFAVSLWKDLVLFEVVQSKEVNVRKAIVRCHQLELNIDEFLGTLSGT